MPRITNNIQMSRAVHLYRIIYIGGSRETPLIVIKRGGL